MNLKQKNILAKSLAVLFSASTLLTATSNISFAMLPNNNPIAQENNGHNNHEGLNEQLFSALDNRDSDECKRLINQGVDVNAKDRDGLTPLHYAADAGDFDICRLLIEKKANVNATDDIDGNTPLRYAADAGNFDVCNLLIEHDAEVNDINRDINILLCVAAANRDHINECRLLIEGCNADVNTRDFNGNTPLHRAAARGCLDTCRLLKEEHNANVNAIGNNGQTPLHQAAIRGHLDTCRLLIEEYNAYINAIDAYGNTPLHLAVAWKRFDVCILLIAHGANVNARNHDGKTPFDYARSNAMRDLLSRYNVQDFCNQEGFHNYCRENNITHLECPICYDTKEVNEFMCVFNCYHDDTHQRPCYEHALCRTCLNRLLNETGLGNICPTCREPLAAHDANR